MTPRRVDAKQEGIQKIGKWRRRGVVSPDEEEKIATWNAWAKRFNMVLDNGFEKTFPDFLEEAVRKMYHDGWKPERAANAFNWGIRQVGHYLPVNVAAKGQVK